MLTGGFSLGTGEVVHILHFCAEEGKMLEFERTVQVKINPLVRDSIWS